MAGLPLSRRTFLAASAGALAVPYFVPKSAFGANDKVVTGHIGLGGQGTGNMGGYADIAAVCDVDKLRLDKVVKGMEEKGTKVEGFGDYRKLLERKDIDAVVISTPDHWHAKTTIDACLAGKDVYCEKPLSLTIAEGRRMVEVARKQNRIVQTGSQQRSDVRFRTACELVRSGKIGKLEKVLVGIPGSNFKGPPVPDSDPPPELDYEFWLGPAPQRPYNKLRVHYNFRFFWDYSGGQMTNFGAHHIDIAQWAMDMDNSGPLEVEGKAEFHPEKWYEVTNTCRLNYKYANGATMIVGQGQKDIPGGVTFVGSSGTIFVDRGKITSTPDEIAKTPLEDKDVHLYESRGHRQNFIDCIKSRKLPICDVEIGHRSATACHLGNIAARLGRKITWDPAAEKMIGDDEAQAMTSRAYRAPWTLG